MEEREGKGKERRKKKESQVLKRGVLVGKRGGNSTPSPTWKYGLAQSDGSLLQDFTFPSNPTSLSARKLGSNLWEVQPHLSFKMNKDGPMPNFPKDKSFQLQHDCPSEQPAGGLRRHVAALKKQQNQSIAENDDAILCESPASCSSSMEMAPYRPAMIPAKMDNEGRTGKSSYSLKTSTELLKVLNRIWILEEQHASHELLVKSLKRKLDHSRIQIKELQQERKLNRQEINELMNQIAEDGKVEEAVKRLRDELEDERKLRKHSENLHRKLARELSEVKSSFSNALRELERERKARVILEDLCDEFAKEIKEYEQEVRMSKCKSRRDQIVGERSDKLILHVSESWLDERMQMKAVDNSDIADKRTILGRLGFEIEEFLRAKKSINCRSNLALSKQQNRSTSRRHSLESFHLEEDGSAPRNENLEGEGESFHGSLHKQENGYTNQNGKSTSSIHLEEITESNPTKKRSQSQELLFSPKMQSEDKIFEETQSKENKSQSKDVDMVKEDKEVPVETKDIKDLQNTKVYRAHSQKRKTKQLHIRSSLINSLIRNHRLSRGGKQHESKEKNTEHSFDPSTFTGPDNPVEKWTSEKTGQEPEPSAEFPGAKENTLKAKLIEARLERQHHHLRASNGS